MKRMGKTMALIALAIMMVFGSTLSAYAATNEVVVEENSVVESEETTVQPRSVNISTSWTTVLSVSTSSSKGINSNVTISATTFTYNGLLSTVPCDIRLLGKTGDVLWSQDDAIPGSGANTVFWCGSDVYTVQIRTTAGNGIASAWKSS